VRDRRPVSDHEGESATGRIWLTGLLSKAGAPTVSGPRAGGAGSPTWFPLPRGIPGVSGRTRRRSLRGVNHPAEIPKLLSFQRPGALGRDHKA
jgi:hypothetical protein